MNERRSLPVAVSIGMHISGTTATRPVYFILRSLTAAAGIFGTLLCFITACENRSIFPFDLWGIMLPTVISWLFFSVTFSLFEKKPALSRGLSCGAVIIILLFGVIKLSQISAGFMYLANTFMARLFIHYRENPLFLITMDFDEQLCSYYAMSFLSLLISAIVCRACVKKPNLLLFFCATFPLAELCLYFGLVPSYPAYAILIASWCAMLAAEITHIGAFADKSAEPLFNKTSAQSAAAGILVGILCFLGAYIYAADFSRPAEIINFRQRFIAYMNDFSWDKFSEDLKSAMNIPESNNATHDGKLGNVSEIEFDGSNMLEVTLPADSATMYLKGFTGTEYTGSRWIEGPSQPPLDTKITSPEFFSGRTLKYIPDYNSLHAKNVIIRNTGVAPSTKYYPVNSAGLLETDGVRRRYGVYFPDNSWRKKAILTEIKLPEEMAEDELRLRAYAHTYCLDVPDTFTAGDEFFSDYNGDNVWDELCYIRSTLAELCDYKLDAGRKPFGSDFANWFLTESRQGSCTHFASATVLLCRTRGIPARYCEGFIIKEEDIRSFEPNGEYVTVSVPDNRAHAWAEIYIDGFGWLSFEATPGYGNIALDVSESWETPETSQITTVTTVPPEFIERPDLTSSLTADPSGTLQTEQTITAEVSEENNAPTQTTSPPKETPPQQNNSASPPTNTEPPSQSDDSSIPETETTSVSSTESHTEIAPAKQNYAEIILPVVIAAVILLLPFVIVIIKRKITFRYRRRLISSNPDKAASDIFRMLMRLAEKNEVRLSGELDTLHTELGKYDFDADMCKTIIQSGMKARFGGGISCSEAEISADSYNQIAQKLFADKSAAKIIEIIRCSDKYV